jgi:hypothetical protein
VIVTLVASALLLGGSAAGGRAVGTQKVCPAKAHVFDGVYHQARFKLLAVCKTAKGVIRFLKLEEDGDLHIQLEVDPAYTNLLNPVNGDEQNGRLVLELTPRDAGHIPKPQKGWRVTVTGVWLTDGKPPSHGWNEIHPIFRLVHAGQTFTSGPQFGGDPDSARSGNAQALCKTETGAACPGY